jgi:putative transposase
MRYRRLKVPGGTYFFTVVTHQRRPLFLDGGAVATFKNVTAQVRARHPFAIEAEVILPDHLHAILSLPEDDLDYSNRWMLIKSGVTRAMNKCSNQFAQQPVHLASLPLPVWQNRFWEHLIRDDNDFGTHVEYIHFNPVKHGLCAAPRDWPHSSFQDFVERGDYPADWGSSDMPKWPDGMERRSE